MPSSHEVHQVNLWKKPNVKKCFGQKVETKDLQGADDAQINIFGSKSKKPNTKVMKCFNCGGNGHGA